MSLVAHLPCSVRGSLTLLLLLGLSACDSKEETAKLDSPAEPPLKVQDSQPAKTLTEIAGRATLPEGGESQKIILQAYEEPFVGRYHANIPCDDNFVPCTEGTAEYILNLKEDGFVHRSIVQYGKVFTEKSMPKFDNANYRRDTWSVNLDENELIVHRKEGVNFYYQIKDPQHLVMDLDKINNGNEGKNKDIFARGYPKPERAYELVKDEDLLQ